MQKYYLAQVNISKLLAPIDSPLLADFVAQLDEINALAEKSKGFVWRLKGDNENATALRIFDDADIIINMSVWETIEDLKEFAFKTAHVGVMRERNKWFEKPSGAMLALWWIPHNYTPTPHDAKERLESINKNGSTPFAFTFKDVFLPIV
ncbi:hypothetical protein Emtol_2496 [Emticicia oligotrophica DSM 17448]|uniref:DUF3291 domain-containing protein n=1 Tax=Emticicia oligotrophica (strain DSM 17448 / CIP 109782 / MTCC 6937 / GPTSA100-15) TaxID=929562 RepID=A0ABN4AQS0_EMTOG|nr:DUF3291 domain-containing protein [Emticicia oligotrophica]AFK03632.1 hypothetical protein Emtol_2496 [Emticicia oligotrophica DSM 17448]